MASVDDIDELIATRKLNGVNDNLYKEDSNIEDVEKLKSLLYKGRLTQYGKRMLIKYYENEIQRQKEFVANKYNKNRYQNNKLKESMKILTKAYDELWTFLEEKHQDILDEFLMEEK